jgi:hypothetical protein
METIGGEYLPEISLCKFSLVTLTLKFDGRSVLIEIAFVLEGWYKDEVGTLSGGRRCLIGGTSLDLHPTSQSCLLSFFR